MKKPELLAPAGGRSQLEAAIRYGADAVYLAIGRFGMRQRAENFASEDIPSVVARCHAAQVKVFVTVNTLMDADDIAALPGYLEALAAAGVDAFIVGDLGANRLARKHAPGVAVHVSTQASVSNAEAACAWHEMGARRVVCAREMSVAEIARMRASVPRDLEIEAFVHGSLCMAVSGRCLISAALNGRSANKGQCTQPCRWNYALMEEKRPGEFFPIEEDAHGSYLMNACDLNMLSHLDDLAAAGVDSFKIEGRNKRAFYVATVVNAYRRVIDGEDPSSVEPELYTVSHRPYDTGFYYGSPTQASDVDGYEKDCLHAATVQACRLEGEGLWRVEATCFNRFCEGDVLEALVPQGDVRAIPIRTLAWLPRSAVEGVFSSPVAVPVANRSSETYAFTSPSPLSRGDFLRVRLGSSSEVSSIV